jgi:hypothetical protein
MIKTGRQIFIGTAVLMIGTIGILSGCKKDNSPPPTTTYQLVKDDVLGVSGTVTFTQTNSTTTTVVITLTGSDSASHPAQINMNSAVEGGAIAVKLNPVTNGTSTTLVNMLNNNSAINYSQLITYNGYVSVIESTINDTLIIAQGDIGGNLLTGTSKTYTLDTVGTTGVSGTALFQMRTNGNTLVSISLTGTLANGTYPAAIQLGSVQTVGGGPIEVTLNPVDGTSGKSYTNITMLDGGTAITYNNLLVYDGYIAVRQSASLSSTILCEGNIGTH